MMQFSAAAGLSRLLIILGVLKPVFQGGDVSEELIQRQVSPQTPSEPADLHPFSQQSTKTNRYCGHLISGLADSVSVFNV